MPTGCRFTTLDQQQRQQKRYQQQPQQHQQQYEQHQVREACGHGYLDSNLIWAEP